MSDDGTWKLYSAFHAYLCDQLWQHLGSIRLDGEEFDVVGGDEVPGFDENAILLRRVSDGQVFDVDIDVTMQPVQPAKPQEPS